MATEGEKISSFGSFWATENRPQAACGSEVDF